VNWQTILTWGLVALASGYLARNAYYSVRSVVQKQGGCGAGCGKCSEAKPQRVAPQTIALQDIRTLKRREK
jgi:bacterioferritin-associated ferredoxin